MTMQRMAEVLEANGFKVSKKYQSLNQGYEFMIEKNGTAVGAFFHYPTNVASHIKDDLQTKFIKNIIEQFEQESKKNMKNIAFDISRDGPVGKLVIKDNVYDVCVKEVDSYSSPYNTNTVLKVEVSGKNLLEPKCSTRTDGIMAQIEAYKVMTTYNPARKDSINEGKLQIKDVIFNPPATIVFWSDGSKTVVKAENEIYDPEKGLAMAIAKRAMGNQGNYFETFKKYIERYKKKIDEELAALEAELQAEQKKPYRIWWAEAGEIHTFKQRTYVREANARKAAAKIFAGTNTKWVVAREDPFKNGVWEKAFGSGDK